MRTPMILNLDHPLDAEHFQQIAEMIGKPINEVAMPITITTSPLEPQLQALFARIKNFFRQEPPDLVIFPRDGVVAALISEWMRRTYFTFPLVVRMRYPVGKCGAWEVQEIVAPNIIDGPQEQEFRYTEVEDWM
mgnify:CR=1 FL=1